MQSPLACLQVVGALIERDGRFMVTRRPASSTSWPGAWEFPGGKVEHGEDDASALYRELLEELGVKVRVDHLFFEVLGHDEGPRCLDLRIYCCDLGNQQPQTLGVDEIRWLKAEDLAALRFPSADRPAVAALIGRAENPRAAPTDTQDRITS